MRAIPQSAVDFVAEFEGLKLRAYKCPADVWTIGYGHTGPEVHAGLEITKAKAKAYLAEDLRTAAAKIEALCGRFTEEELPEPRWTALLSFVFNLGLNGSWRLTKLLKARKFDGVPAQLSRFVNAGGKPVAGLIRRRAAEVALWHEAETQTVDLPSSFTRSEPTPPTPEATKPMVQSRTVMTGAAQLVGSVSAGALAVQQTVAPHATSAAVLGKVVTALAVFMAACGVILLAIKWLEKREAQR